MRSVSCAILLALSPGSELYAQNEESRPITSGRYTVLQTWSQEKNFERPWFVRVPVRRSARKLPVFIFLHGNGGTAERSMNGMMRRLRAIAASHIMVFPDGYARSWNIVSERSRADDSAFVEAIIRTLAQCSNVEPNSFTIMGNSNGAALVNQLAIESKLPNIRNLISAVSPLNVYQHNGKGFRARGKDNNYSNIVRPPTGRRLLNISGTKDRLVPYNGGPSPVIPAKNGRLAFVAAEESTFLWARHMGHRGERLTKPTRTQGKLGFYEYLDGDVVHIKVNDEGHGAGGAVSEKILLEFMNHPPKLLETL